jgi:hypothetical protein
MDTDGNKQYGNSDRLDKWIGIGHEVIVLLQYIVSEELLLN